MLWHCNEKWLERVAFLRHGEPEFIAEVILRLYPMVFAPGDVIFSTRLYIVHRGLALFGGRVLTHGMVWGEDMLLTAEHLRSRCCAKALNYFEVYFINRDDLLVIASRFPATYKRIRQHIVKLAIRRMIVLMTREKETSTSFGSPIRNTSANCSTDCWARRRAPPSPPPAVRLDDADYSDHRGGLPPAPPAALAAAPAPAAARRRPRSRARRVPPPPRSSQSRQEPTTTTRAEAGRAAATSASSQTLSAAAPEQD